MQAQSSSTRTRRSVRRARAWQIAAAVVTVLATLAIAAPAMAWPIMGC
jgi:hypothetical protein